MRAKIRQLFGYYKMGLLLDLKDNIAYPATFWFTTISVPLWIVVQILFIETIYGQTASFLGYTKYENYVLFGTFKVVQSIAVLLCMVNLDELPDRIRGTSDRSFDVMLLKPIDSQVFANTGSYWFGSISSLIPGIGMVVYGLMHSSHVFGIGEFVGYSIAVLLGVVLLYLTYLFIQTWLFWFEYLRTGQELWFTLQGFGQFPTSLYSGGVSVLFNIVFPITLMGAIPVELLFGKMLLSHLLLYVAIVAILFVLTRKFWQYSIKKYSSFSS